MIFEQAIVARDPVWRDLAEACGIRPWGLYTTMLGQPNCLLWRLRDHALRGEMEGSEPLYRLAVQKAGEHFHEVHRAPVIEAFIRELEAA